MSILRYGFHFHQADEKAELIAFISSAISTEAEVSP